MTPYSEPELEAMLGEIELDCVERKKSLSGDAATKVREAICAFANDLPGRAKPLLLADGERPARMPEALRIVEA